MRIPLRFAHKTDRPSGALFLIFGASPVHGASSKQYAPTGLHQRTISFPLLSPIRDELFIVSSKKEGKAPEERPKRFFASRFLIRCGTYLRLSVILFGLAVSIAGCGGTKEAAKDPQVEFNRRIAERMQEAQRDRALNHFIQGAVYDAKGEYANAVLEYQDALRDDPNPAIYYAISKDYSILGKHALAAQAARESVTLDSTNISYRENLAGVYMNAFQHDLALKEYETIVQIDSNYISGWYTLARLYQTTKPLKALEIYERILDRQGDDWEVLFQTAEIYTSLGKYDQAAEKYKRMLELDPSNKALQRQLAETYSRAGNFKDAKQLLESILEIDGDNPEALGALADVYLDQREFEKALELYQKLLRKEKDNSEVKLRVAIAYYGQIQRDSTFIEKAKPIFEEVSQATPNDWRPYWYLGIIAATEHRDSVASKYLERVTQLAEWNGDAWYYLGTSYFDKGQYQKLLETMERAKKAIPKDHRVYFLIGLAYTRLNQQEQAVAMLRQALELKPDDLNTISTLALTLDGLKRFTESDELYEKALKVDPKYHLVLNNYSYSLAERGLQLERALQMALDAIAQEPENASYLDTIGWVYYKLGRHKEAEQYIGKAVAIGGASAAVYEHFGDIYFKLGDKEKAEKFWKQALEMNSTNQALKEKVARGSL